MKTVTALALAEVTEPLDTVLKEEKTKEACIIAVLPCPDVAVSLGPSALCIKPASVTNVGPP